MAGDRNWATGGGRGGGGSNTNLSNRWRGRTSQYRRATDTSHSPLYTVYPAAPGHASGEDIWHCDLGIPELFRRPRERTRAGPSQGTRGSSWRSSSDPVSSEDRAEVEAAPGKESEEKSRNAANFECNVCFDIAADPVVTKCGHLFCWQCLYQWLHVHSEHRECPVCKGEVADDAIIPIYGRGGSAACVAEKAGDNVAPPRPSGARVESSRQQQLHLMPDLQTDEEVLDVFGDYEWLGPEDAVMDMDSEVQIEPEYEVFEANLSAWPMFGPMPGWISQPRGGLLNAFSSQSIEIEVVDTETGVTFFTGNNHHQAPAFYGMDSWNPEPYPRQRRSRQRPAISADQTSAASTNGMIEGDAAFNVNRVGPSNASSSRPDSRWARRRGRSSSSNQADGGGIHPGRRRRTNNRIILD